MKNNYKVERGKYIVQFRIHLEKSTYAAKLRTDHHRQRCMIWTRHTSHSNILIESVDTFYLFYYKFVVYLMTHSVAQIV